MHLFNRLDEIVEPDSVRHADGICHASMLS
jgi:hypothetical protein